MTPLVPFSVPRPPAKVMLGRSPPSGLLMKARPTAAPRPTAGSVMGVAIGRNPYLVSRNPLMSIQPSSADRNFDGATAGAAVPATADWPDDCPAAGYAGISASASDNAVRRQTAP